MEPTTPDPAQPDEQGDTLHGASLPIESAHEHEQDQPKPAEPEAPAESDK